jgi:hypothetical protein
VTEEDDRLIIMSTLMRMDAKLDTIIRLLEDDDGEEAEEQPDG